MTHINSKKIKTLLIKLQTKAYQEYLKNNHDIERSPYKSVEGMQNKIEVKTVKK